jgi:hypothetical protein
MASTVFDGASAGGCICVTLHSSIAYDLSVSSDVVVLRSLGYPCLSTASESQSILAPEPWEGSIAEKLLLKVFHHASEEGFRVHCFDVSPALEGKDVAT